MRTEIIYRHNGEPYLWRLHILHFFGFAILLHHFLASDDECLHDHPWWYISIILWGGYWENTDYGKKWYWPGSILFRHANWSHRIKINKKRLTWSLVIHGRDSREWGFWTKNGWIHNKQYNNNLCN
jgi:hypothetical protein